MKGYFVCDYPFIMVSDGYDGTYWSHGCRIKSDDGTYSGNYFEMDGLGKRFVRKLSVAKMPSPFVDRVVYQVWYQDPEGFNMKKYVRQCTVSAFEKILSGFTNRIPIYDCSNRGVDWCPEESTYVCND